MPPSKRDQVIYNTTARPYTLMGNDGARVLKIKIKPGEQSVPVTKDDVEILVKNAATKYLFDQGLVTLTDPAYKKKPDPGIAARAARKELEEKARGDF